ncbi:MAG TPA: hypothetical protein VFQ35_28960, partial [Polyangiaceae bacterium]|nr:hypothetical protein [Polyangiaceae bacterium]
GVVSTLLCWWAARLLDFSRASAFIGAAICAVLPYSAYLGAAPVPEAPCAGLIVFAAATLVHSGRVRLLGAAALFAACASRYEAWGVALPFAAFTGWEAWRKRDRTLAAAALGGLAFPVLWLLHGIVRHGDATFFVARVSAYRAALGPQDAILERLVRTPRALLLEEPVLGAVFIALTAFSLLVARVENLPKARFALVVFGVVLLTWLGDIRGSAPTHHPGRALLAAWFAMALLSSELYLRALPCPARRTLALPVVGGALLVGMRFSRALQTTFVDRRDAVAIGAAARQRAFARLAIDTDDYAFFAVQAAFGHPSETLVLDDRDPRKPRAQPWTNDPQKLLRTLRDSRVSALVVPRTRAPFAHAVGSVSEENSGFSLIELTQR